MSAAQSNISEQFYLHGTQINFNERAKCKQRTCGRGGMGCRPCSAVPALTSFEPGSPMSLSKRPFSADTLLAPDKKPFSVERHSFCEARPAKERDADSSDLPSAQIFKSLLSETVENGSWNRAKDASVRSVQDLSAPLLLLPGVKTKPPLPSKFKPSNKSDAQTSNTSEEEQEQEQEQVHMFDFMSNGHEVFEERRPLADADADTDADAGVVTTAATSATGMMDDAAITSDNCYVEDLEDSDKVEDGRPHGGGDRAAVPAERPLFTEWPSGDDQRAQTEQVEKHTDRQFENVRRQQHRLDENIYDLGQLLHGAKDKRDAVHRGAGSGLRGARSAKLPAKDAGDACSKKQPKGILKGSAQKKPASQAQKRSASTRATESSQSGAADDVTSWMSANVSHDNFLEFLTKLDEFDMEAGAGVEAGKGDGDGFDEITSILQVLEKEDLKSQRNIESMKELVGGELRAAAHTKSADARSGSTCSLSSSASCTELLSYLDEIDQSCVDSLKTAKQRVLAVAKCNNRAINVEQVPRLEELLAYSQVELAHYVADLTLRLKERSSAVGVLQAELGKLRAALAAKSSELEKSLKDGLKTQKDDYEAIIKRHQKFIDQLIADKKALNKQCEGLINEMKVLEDRYNTNMKAMEQRHKVELQKTKDMQAAGEKLRREKWIEGKTQKIKEMTVKSLEPELQAMAARHQQELADLRSLHKRELEELELRAARRTQQQCEALRQQLTAEREQAIAHERDVLRQRIEKLVESEEKGYQEQRRRLNAEHAAKVAECEERVAAAVGERDRAIEAARAEYEQQLQAAQRRHSVELRNVRESIELEFEVWKNNFRKQQTIKLAETEAQMKEACKKDRDREIEMVIERLEQETNETREQIEQATENRLRRIKDKYEEEIRDVEKALAEYKAKYGEAREKLLAGDDALLTLTTSVKHLQGQLQQARQVIEEQSMDKSKLAEQIRAELQSEMDSLHNELQSLRCSKEDELQRIFAKVKVTVAHKDELLAALTKSNSELQEKCTLLENLLQQKQKEYLLEQ